MNPDLSSNPRNNPRIPTLLDSFHIPTIILAESVMPNTRVLNIQPGEDFTEAIAQAAQTLRSGGIVAFPTETVYGVGARADLPDAVARLRQLKRRPDNKPFTVHLGRREIVERFVPRFQGVGKRLVTKAWPGPLTLVFTGIDPATAPIMADLPAHAAAQIYHEGTVGLRCPDDPTASALLNNLNQPVVAASANLAGKPPAKNADQALSALDGQADLILDGGTARYAKPSTVVKLNHTGYQIIRDGVFDHRTIKRLATLNILLVCTGNTCRSPMAAALLRDLLARQLGVEPNSLDDRGINVQSAGTFASAGAPASPQAVQALKDREIDLTPHRSQPLTAELINQADHIFTMTESHQQAILQMAPSAAQRVEPLDPQADIADPIGQHVNVYRACADKIDAALQHRLPEVLS
ncbi:MAG: L-threonylcarbamoyladenylate synthase [Phycisphaerae bacterium]